MAFEFYGVKGLVHLYIKNVGLIEGEVLNGVLDFSKKAQQLES